MACIMPGGPGARRLLPVDANPANARVSAWTHVGVDHIPVEHDRRNGASGPSPQRDQSRHMDVSARAPLEGFDASPLAHGDGAGDMAARRSPGETHTFR